MTQDEDEIRIILVRHGLSEGNLDESLYIQKGDSNIGLAKPLGWEQAYHNGLFLKQLYKITGTTEWPTLFLSPHLRTHETLAGILHGMQGTFPIDPKIYEDPRLIEKFFGAASGLEYLEGLDPGFVNSAKKLSKKVYAGDPYATAHFLGESTKQTQGFVKSFIDGTLRRDIEGGKKDFLIVTHGAIIQAFIMNWAHISPRNKNKIGNPNNCDIIEIRGKPGKWTITKIYDGETYQPANRNMLENVRHLTVADLPPVPTFLQNRM